MGKAAVPTEGGDRRGRRLAVLSGAVGLLALLAPVATAAAATVGVGKFEGEFQITAAPGEVNDLLINASGPREEASITIEDRAAPLSAGTGCAPEGSAIRCDGVGFLMAKTLDGDDRLTITGSPQDLQITATLGAGDDAALIDGLTACLDAGPGDDVVRVGVATDACSIDGVSGNDQLFGGPGTDRLNGGAGRDQLDGGAGDDYLSGDADGDRLAGGPGGDISLEGGTGDDRIEGGEGNDFLGEGTGDDVLLGGAGNDSFSFGFGSSGNDQLLGGAGLDSLFYLGAGFELHLDSVANDRERGSRERDRIDVESALFVSRVNDRDGPPSVYGSGDDVITGDAQANRFTTQRGDDRVTGGGGADVISTGHGDDVIGAADGKRDARIDCGGGTDHAVVDPADRARHCERVEVVRR